MLQRIIGWALGNTLVVLLLAMILAVFGSYSFKNVNVEAYPDPSPAIIEVISQYNGASAEEVERQVTIPLEITLAGMPELKYTRTRSLFGLSHLRLQFEYGMPYPVARQEVLNRLGNITQPLPAGVNAVISPSSPTGEIYRYTLSSPKEGGRDVYTLNDLKALQDWSLEREFRRVPRIVDVSSSGGTVKRYEIHPDPERLRRYGITLSQVSTAISNANMNSGGDVLILGANTINIRNIGLYGGGSDPMQSKKVMGAGDPYESSRALRSEDERRVRAIRDTVVTTINNFPIKVSDLVEGGPLQHEIEIGMKGVVVGNQTRLGKVALSKPKRDAEGREIKDKDGNSIWTDEQEKIQCIVLLRKGEDSLPALKDVQIKVKELNDPKTGTILPGVKIEPYYDRTELIESTTDTVSENLVVGISLVAVILLMFLGNVRVALIVAINIPLALLFAFAMLFARGKSANLLSIGAVDFGIIVDSSVIMAENIFRKLTSAEHSDESLKDRIQHSSNEITRPLLFSTLIMVVAFIPLFAMKGAEGQLFGPMADTYAFALAGGLALAALLTPVLCRLFLGNVKEARDNFLVRNMKFVYLHLLGYFLTLRWFFVAFMLALLTVTIVYAREHLGREFMPELEEGNLWIRGMYPRGASLDTVSEGAKEARKVMMKYPEIDAIANQMGRPDDGTDPEGFYKSEFFVPLKSRANWPAAKPVEGWMKRFADTRPRTKRELVAEMTAELRRATPGVDWNFSQNIRDNVMESISGVKGDNSVKIFGPDLNELERLAGEVEKKLKSIDGIADVGTMNVMGQPNMEIPWDPVKCRQWGVSVSDLQTVIQTAVGGAAFSTMIEGEKRFDISLRFPKHLRDSEEVILDIPVDIVNNQVLSSYQAQNGGNRGIGPSMGLSPTGTSNTAPALEGSASNGNMPNFGNTPRRKLKDLVTPFSDSEGTQGPNGKYVRTGASMVFREQGKRMIAVKFSVRNRDLAGAVEEAKRSIEELIEPPYHTEWSGEFEQMQAAEARMMLIIPIAIMLIFVLLYLAFNSLLDAVVVLSNVVALSIGGIWALILTDTHYSTSAAVGFVSLFGVAIMGGLLMVSYFNSLRAHGVPLREAIMEGAEKRLRPVVMTAMTAILGLLPAALALRPAWDPTGHFRFIEPIGVQTQRPLAIVVVGGMITSLLLTQYLMPVLYSFYGHREPPEGSGSMAH